MGVVVFDMDNTLVETFGAVARPGVAALLGRLRADGHTLVLWTNSTRGRAVEILRRLDLRRYFHTCIFREDYDPDERDVPKDIRTVNGDILIDDDPEAIRYARSTGRKGFLIRPYRRGDAIDRRELAELYAAVKRGR